jgi:hypothetical protein
MSDTAKKIWDFVARHATWLALGMIALLILSPGLAEIKTILLIAAIEALSIALSGIALYAFTKVDFTKYFAGANPGLIFLGVHICVGMSVLGVYLVQFGS